MYIAGTISPTDHRGARRRPRRRTPLIRRSGRSAVAPWRPAMLRGGRPCGAGSTTPRSVRRGRVRRRTTTATAPPRQHRQPAWAAEARHRGRFAGVAGPATGRPGDGAEPDAPHIAARSYTPTPTRTRKHDTSAALTTATPTPAVATDPLLRGPACPADTANMSDRSEDSGGRLGEDDAAATPMASDIAAVATATADAIVTASGHEPARRDTTPMMDANAADAASDRYTPAAASSAAAACTGPRETHPPEDALEHHVRADGRAAYFAAAAVAVVSLTSMRRTSGACWPKSGLSTTQRWRALSRW